MKIVYLIPFIALFLIPYNLFGQQDGNQKVKESFVFFIRNRYNNEVLDFPNIQFQYYQFFGGYYFDRKNKDEINYNYVDEGLLKFYPSENDSGFLSIDIENKIYKDIMNYNISHPLYKMAIDELVNLVKYINISRPNVQVGIYGLPFSFYYKSQEQKNAGNKLEPILTIVDYISPSLYIHYPDKQRGKNSNLEYLRRNLNLALYYGEKFNKPVIPYVWYLIHPKNKIYGSELIEKSAMVSYLNLIRDLSFNEKKISGIIWWQPNRTNYKLPLELKNIEKAKMDLNEVLLYYLPEIIE